MDRIGDLWRRHCIGEHAFWRHSGFWLAASAIVLPFGWALLALGFKAERVRAYFRRDDA